MATRQTIAHKSQPRSPMARPCSAGGNSLRPGRPGPAGLFLAWLLALLCAVPLHAAEFTLHAPPELIDDGLIGYLAPRYALKHGVNMHVQAIDDVNNIPPEDAAILPLEKAPEGSAPVIEGPAGRYAIIAPDEGPAAGFAKWLKSDIGRRTIAAFRLPDGSAPHAPAQISTPKAESASFEGDPRRGEALSYANCGRCHVVGPRNRMKSIGSTPSFAALRALADWEERFRTFWLRNPHPALVRIKDVSQEPDISSPSPISPVALTERDLQDILAFVSRIKAADLGAPIQIR